MALRVIDSNSDYDTGAMTIEAEIVGHAGWLVEGVFVPADPGFVLAEVHVRPTGEIPEGGVRADLMRQVSLTDLHGGLVEQSADWKRIADGRGSIKMSKEGLEEAERLAFRMGLGARSARNLSGDANLARWASWYVEELADHPRSPISALAKRRRKARVQVSNLIEQARAAGLLTRPGKGSAHGVLTERGIELLREAERGKHR